jgi:hypothetical protein
MYSSYSVQLLSKARRLSHRSVHVGLDDRSKEINWKKDNAKTDAGESQNFGMKCQRTFAFKKEEKSNPRRVSE